MGTLVAHAELECQGWDRTSSWQGWLREVLYQWRHNRQFVQLSSSRFRQSAKSGPAQGMAQHAGAVRGLRSFPVCPRGPVLGQG